MLSTPGLSELLNDGYFLLSTPTTEVKSKSRAGDSIRFTVGLELYIITYPGNTYNQPPFSLWFDFTSYSLSPNRQKRLGSRRGLDVSNRMQISEWNT